MKLRQGIRKASLGVAVAMLCTFFFTLAYPARAASEEPPRSATIIHRPTALRYAEKEAEGLVTSYLLQMDHKNLRHRFTIVDASDVHHRIDVDAQTSEISRHFEHVPKNNYASTCRTAKITLTEAIKLAEKAYPGSFVVKADLVGKKAPAVFEIQLYDKDGRVVELTMRSSDGKITNSDVKKIAATTTRREADVVALRMTPGGRIISTMLVETGGLAQYIILHLGADGIFQESGINAKDGSVVYNRFPD